MLADGTNITALAHQIDELAAAAKAIEAEAAQPAPAEATAEPRTYTVRYGDTLASIAAEVYGDPDRAAEIHAANAGHLTNPDALMVNHTIILP